MGTTKNGTRRALPTEFSGLDPRTGKPCHRESHTCETKGTYRAARRADSLGLHVAAGVLDPRTGIGTCALCGGAGTLAMGDTGRAAAVTLVLAHDFAQRLTPTTGGAVCWCSMVLAHQSCNLVQGDTRLSEWVRHCDAREFAAGGGHWAPYAGSRNAFSLDSVRAGRTGPRPDGLTPLTPAAADRLATVRLSLWR